jgi:zinc/manganese transport system substrate-binding protein
VVTSVISNPNIDPHDYDATPNDARLIARANYVIENGAGYDPWVAKLVSANPVAGRRTLDVGDLVGVPVGGNPHLWYSPDYVERVIARMTQDLKKLDSAGSSYFDQQSASYNTSGLKAYHDAIAAIRQKYDGTPVGASESIFVYLAQATALNLVTPPGYMKAISDGAEPSVADRVAVDGQLTGRQVRVFVFNSQNSTPDVQTAVDEARAAAIPVVPITETLSPAGTSFQDWQVRQLDALLKALGG